MIYGFKDTTETGQSMNLPAEAVCIDGIWLDREVDGYTTLAVQGRELLGVRFSELEKMSGGTTASSLRYPPREIEVQYMIKSRSASEFRRTFNKLAALLCSGKESQFIFADEPDKYFTGFVSDRSDPERGRLCATGTFTIHCPDPHKYSLTKTPFKAKLKDGVYQLTVANSGTVDVPVDIRITASAKTKYLEIHDEQGNSLRVGDMSAPETETVTNPILAGQGSFTVRSEHDALHPSHTAFGKLASVLVRPDDPDTVKYPECEWICLDPANKGSAPTAGAGFGGVAETGIFMTPPVDWDCYLFHWFQCNGWQQAGSQSISFLASDGTIIAAHNIYKASGSSEAIVELTVKGDVKKVLRFKPDNTGVYGRGTNGYNRIRKEGAKVTFHFNGTYYPFVDESIKNKPVQKVQIKIGGYQGKELLTRNYFKDIEFKALNMSYSVMDDEGFPPGQTIMVDSVNEKVTALSFMDCEQMGSVYPVVPAESVKTFSFVFSPWFNGDAEITAQIREAWL